MSINEVRLDRPHPAIAVIRIDRPDQRNALNLAVKRLLIDVLRACEADPDILMIVLTGGDRYFVAGTDVAEMLDMTPDSHVAMDTGAVFEVVRACAKPVIAAVEGFALGGGCELALACDILVAGSGARFGQPEIKVGIMPGAGGTQVLARAAGRHRAILPLLLGTLFSAQDAFSMGLVSEIVEDGKATSRAIEIAHLLAAMPARSVRAIKRVVREGEDLPMRDALAVERSAFVQLFGSHDQREGMSAFVEKRPPVFKGD